MSVSGRSTYFEPSQLTVRSLRGRCSSDSFIGRTCLTDCWIMVLPRAAPWQWHSIFRSTGHSSSAYEILLSVKYLRLVSILAVPISDDLPTHQTYFLHLYFVSAPGSDHSLGVNICFPQTTRIALYSLAPVLIVMVSLLISWNGPIGAHVVTWFQLTLLLTITGLWIWLSGELIGANGQPGLVDIWLLLCVIVLGGTSCLAVLEQRWSDRILLQRKRRCLRTPSLSLLQNKAAAIPGTPALNVNSALNTGCFQGCACGGSNSGACPDNCMSCTGLQGRASGGFVSTNGTSGVYCSNSSCGASGHVCSGMGTHGQGNSAGNSPAPMGFSPQPIGIGGTKLVRTH